MNNQKECELKIFAGNSNPKLAEKIADKLGVKISDCHAIKFSDGELSLDCNENVYGHDVFIIQSTSNPAAEHIFEMMMMCDSAKRSGAARVIGVIPYFGYARQDRKIETGDCITAKLAVSTLESAGFDAYILLDLHSMQIEGFFKTPMTHHINCSSIIESYFSEKISEFGKSNVALVSPDAGSFKRGQKQAKSLGIEHVGMEKYRPAANVAEAVAIIGEVKDKVIFMSDDIIDTAGTICEAAKLLKERGCREIFVAATHGVLSGNALERIKNAPITELALMQTIARPNQKNLPKMRFLPTADIIAEAIYKMHMGYDLNAPLYFLCGLNIKAKNQAKNKTAAIPLLVDINPPLIAPNNPSFAADSTAP